MRGAGAHGFQVPEDILSASHGRGCTLPCIQNALHALREAPLRELHQHLQPLQRGHVQGGPHAQQPPLRACREICGDGRRRRWQRRRPCRVALALRRRVQHPQQRLHGRDQETSRGRRRTRSHMSGGSDPAGLPIASETDHQAAPGHTDSAQFGAPRPRGWGPACAAERSLLLRNVGPA